MSKFFTLAHAPFGGDGCFSIGKNGGGVKIASSRLACDSIYIGYRQKDTLRLLPFYDDSNNPANSFTSDYGVGSIVKHDFTEAEVTRAVTPCEDSITAGKFEIKIITPFYKCPNFDNLDTEDLKKLVAPIVLIEIIFDNRQGDEDITGIFALSNIQGREKTTQTNGFYTFNGGYGVCSSSESTSDFDVCSFVTGSAKDFVLAPISGFRQLVPSGEKKSMKIVIGFYKSGVVTSGNFAYPYFYTTIFKSIDQVLSYGFKNFDNYKAIAANTDNYFKGLSGGSDDLKLFSHAVKGYFASTSLFGSRGNYLYVVNEGSFRMLNTLDLFIDHIFFESEFYPFAVSNQLKTYYEYYSYTDVIKDDKNSANGISFCHDIGCFNIFTPTGTSSYEIEGTCGCYSYMTTEQLYNFVIACAINDRNGYSMNFSQDELLALYNSILMRDSILPETRLGVMNINSSKCGDGGEITTYDSIDHSLGVSRGNLYLNMKRLNALKCIQLLSDNNTEFIASVQKEFMLVLKNIEESYDETQNKFFANKQLNVETAILPVIEPLIYFKVLNIEIPHRLKSLCAKHLQTVLKKGSCLFEDGGFKLSASSVNSWQSKVFICIVIAESILQEYSQPQGDAINNKFEFREILHNAKRAHLEWWENGCEDNCAIDQVFDGRTLEKGFYYPRGISSFLFFTKL